MKSVPSVLVPVYGDGVLVGYRLGVISVGVVRGFVCGWSFGGLLGWGYSSWCRKWNWSRYHMLSYVGFNAGL